MSTFQHSASRFPESDRRGARPAPPTGLGREGIPKEKRHGVGSQSLSQAKQGDIRSSQPGPPRGRENLAWMRLPEAWDSSHGRSFGALRRLQRSMPDFRFGSIVLKKAEIELPEKS